MDHGDRSTSVVAGLEEDVGAPLARIGSSTQVWWRRGWRPVAMRQVHELSVAGREQLERAERLADLGERRARHRDLEILVRSGFMAQPQIQRPSAGDAPLRGNSCEAIRELARRPRPPGVDARWNDHRRRNRRVILPVNACASGTFAIVAIAK